MEDESFRGGDDFFVAKDESALDKFSKSPPSLGGVLEKDASGKKAPDPSRSSTSRSSKSSKSPKTVRKTAIKASDLGIDLKDISSETLNQAVKKCAIVAVSISAYHTHAFVILNIDESADTFHKLRL